MSLQPAIAAYGLPQALFLLLNRGPLYQAFDYVLAAARKPE